MSSEPDFEDRRRYIIETLASQGIIPSQKVKMAIMRVPREEFVPEGLREHAYFDTPLQIGCSQTISAIHMVAIMTEALELDAGQKVLEVGAGSGYHSAVVAEVVSPLGVAATGHVYSIEILPELAELAAGNLERAGYADRVTVICGDGSKGYPEKALYDRIFVTSAAPKIPKPLIEQLKVGGILVIPVGGLYFFQDLLKVTKVSEEKTTTKNLGSVAFVPLRGEHGWKS